MTPFYVTLSTHTKRSAGASIQRLLARFTLQDGEHYTETLNAYGFSPPFRMACGCRSLPRLGLGPCSCLKSVRRQKCPMSPSRPEHHELPVCACWSGAISTDRIRYCCGGRSVCYSGSPERSEPRTGTGGVRSGGLKKVRRVGRRMPGSAIELRYRVQRNVMKSGAEQSHDSAGRNFTTQSGENLNAARCCSYDSSAPFATVAARRDYAKGYRARQSFRDL